MACRRPRSPRAELPTSARQHGATVRGRRGRPESPRSRRTARGPTKHRQRSDRWRPTARRALPSSTQVAHAWPVNEADLESRLWPTLRTPVAVHVPQAPAAHGAELLPVESTRSTRRPAGRELRTTCDRYRQTAIKRKEFRSSSSPAATVLGRADRAHKIARCDRCMRCISHDRPTPLYLLSAIRRVDARSRA